jgi:Ni/Co efflux regulator RcnB
MKHAITAAMLISLIASSVAVADSSKGHDDRWDQRDERRDDRWDQRYDRRDDRWDRRDYRRDDRWDRRDHRRDDRWDRRDHRRDDRWDRRDDRRDYWKGRVRGGKYDYPRGYRPHHWRRGERLPAAYYARPYVIRDYRECDLHSPPRGAHWVRVNNDVILAAIATGIVLEVLNNHFY